MEQSLVDYHIYFYTRQSLIKLHIAQIIVKYSIHLIKKYLISGAVLHICGIRCILGYYHQTLHIGVCYNNKQFSFLLINLSYNDI